MAHWPKTVSGNLFVFALVVLVTPIVVWIAVSLSGPLVWASLAIVALASVALYAWRRRVESARDRAWVGQFSFGDVVRRMRAREALDVSHGLEGVL
jgi:membrane protein implicated in regulation of membrane protease activity